MGILKKSFLIVTVVAGYSLLDAVFLLSSIPMSPQGPFPSSYQAVVWWSQLLLIPGLAALFSRLMYGSYHGLRRALGIVAVGALGLPASIFLIIGAAYVLGWAASISTVLWFVFLVLIPSGMILALLLFAHRANKRGVQLEAMRWLAERQAQTSPSERKSRTRSVCVASWLPCLTVLLVFLFLPQIWGVFTHFVRPEAGLLSGYRTRIPVTWIVLDARSWPDGRSWTTGLAEQGFGVTLVPYLHRRFKIAEWSVETRGFSELAQPDHNEWTHKDDEVTDRRVLIVGNDAMSCVEYAPTHFTRLQLLDASIVSVECSASARLSASFTGDRSYVPMFYKMLETTTQINGTSQQ